MSDKKLEIYKQNSEHFRSLNSKLWNVPAIAMTINGGLWIAIGKMPLESWAFAGIALFAAVCDLCLIPVLFRVRKVMDIYLKLILDFEDEPPRPGFGVVKLFTAMLAMAAGINIVLAVSAVVGLDANFFFLEVGAESIPMNSNGTN